MRERESAVRVLHVGGGLADDHFDEELRRHLQARLRILYGVMAGAALAFFAIYHVQHWLDGTWDVGRDLTGAPRLIHLAILALSAGIFIALQRSDLSKRMLRVLDAAVLYLAAGACLGMYAVDFKEGQRDLVAILGVFVIGRAVVIPSTARRTILLSLPIPLALLAIDLAYGTAYNYDGTEMKDPADVASACLWSQVLLLFAISVATIASRVTYALRARIAAARRVGHYTLEEKIGEGGMGQVYRATHRMLRRRTAVKFLRPEIMGADTIPRFEKEVRVASRLSHPNTIRIFDYGRTPEGVFYCAMEYVHGLDLFEVVRRDGPLPPGRVVHVLEQACRALSEAHGLGLVHRDVKPGNIMICVKGGEHDVVKILDFGLVKELGREGASFTELGTVSGSVETLAPEVISGEEPSPACDLYALGVVGCFLLTGEGIFDAKSPGEYILCHAECAPIAPSARGVNVPADLEAVLLRCLRKRPADRPASAQALAAELRACAAYHTWTEEQAAAWWRDVARPGKEVGTDDTHREFESQATR